MRFPALLGFQDSSLITKASTTRQQLRNVAYVIQQAITTEMSANK